MSSPNESQHDQASPEPPNSGESTHAGHSGEGAASALAHLKTQARQHRHQAGNDDDAAAGGPTA